VLTGAGRARSSQAGGRERRRPLRALAPALAAALAAAASVGAGAGAGPGAARAAVSTAPPAGQPPPTVAYVTEPGQSPPTVWAMRTDGSQRTRLGAGSAPLVAPGGQLVAASLFGAGTSETGPALAVYSTTGAAPLTYLSLAGESATALAWSPDGRYLAVDVQSTAVKNPAKLSGLAIVDLQQNTLKVIAHGQLYGASFAPNGSDEVVYGLSASQSLSAPVNVYRNNPEGSAPVALTRDGRSLYPVWGPGAIAYDRERLRPGDAPVYQIWLRSAAGSHARRLTKVRVRSLVSGLVPLAFSSDGTRLLAQFSGQDTSEAWTVRVPSGRARRLPVRGRSVQAAALSRDGRTVLINGGGFLGPASEGRVATVPFGGGAETLLVAHASEASWNG
jgi:dipeptidyl aminopeptidase/acylaminoacyl peptidase